MATLWQHYGYTVSRGLSSSPPNDTKTCARIYLKSRITPAVEIIYKRMYRGADKSLARPGRKQANVSVRMASISFGALTCRKKKNLMTARVSMLLKSRASLTCFRAFFLPGRTKNLHAPRVCMYVCMCVCVCECVRACMVGWWIFPWKLVEIKQINFYT